MKNDYVYFCEIILAYSNLKIIDDLREKNETYPEGNNKHIIKELSKSFSHTSRFIFFPVHTQGPYNYSLSRSATCSKENCQIKRSML